MTKSKKSFTSTEIIALVLQQITILQAIIVERNVHAYYRLPIGEPIKTNDKNREYQILQCPHRATTDIPLPKDMPICAMVGNYKDNYKDGRAKVTPVRVLSTEVEFKPKQGTEVDMMKWSTRRPSHVMKLQPFSFDQKFKAAAKRPFKEVRYRSDTKTRIPKNIPTKAEEKSDKSFAKQKKPSSTFNFSPLRFLSAFNNFNYFRPDDKAEAYHVGLEKYGKGQATRGYHNVYHRDELQNDHIFYDDLEQAGQFRSYGSKKT